MKPEWKDGEPANDAAAMADALEWLLVLSRWKAIIATAKSRAALDRCIADLRKRLSE